MAVNIYNYQVEENFALREKDFEPFFSKCSEFWNDFSVICACYDIYKYGCNPCLFDIKDRYIKDAFRGKTEDAHSIPDIKIREDSMLHFRHIAMLINKEARFLFGKAPRIELLDIENEKQTEESTEIDMLNLFLDKVLSDSNFETRLLQAAKDCFVGKRVLALAQFTIKGIFIDFIPSTNFLYEYDEFGDISNLAIFKKCNCKEGKQLYHVMQYMLVTKEKVEGVFYTEYFIDEEGKKTIKVKSKKMTMSRIPAVIIKNDGLLSDYFGISEIEQLCPYELQYNRLASEDLDAQRDNMHPERYTIDARYKDSAAFKMGRRAYNDIAGDYTTSENAKPQIGLLESKMNFSKTLNDSLNRVRSSMYEELDIPDISLEKLQGVITSGKSLKAVYWSLIVRCTEKMKAWRPALTKIIQIVIEEGKKFPDSYKYMGFETLPDIKYLVKVEQMFPLPEDEHEEKAMDLNEISAGVLSKVSYLKKWKDYTEEQAVNELRQIAFEKALFEQREQIPFEVAEKWENIFKITDNKEERNE